MTIKGTLVLWLFSTLAWSQGVSPIVESTLRKTATHDVVSERELQRQVKGRIKLGDALRSASTKQVDARPAAESSLLSGSIILFDGDKFTLVPAGSILNLPESYRSRVIPKPKGEFTFWPSFLQRNTSWLAAREVPLAMARGDSKAARSVLNAVSTDSRVLVAVYKGGPITVLEAPPQSGPPQAKPGDEP